MTSSKIEIIQYRTNDRSELLRLLLELHSTYFSQNASLQIQELRKDKDIKKSYEDYLDFIEKREGDSWQIFRAISETNNILGFIIGSIETDDEMVLGKLGKFEDWFVEEQFRGQGIGIKLYNELEKWFIEKKCQQIISDTWQGNELSIKAHQRLGFFISGVKFTKKI